jgi:ParB-like chromosome segregation protein Spo0J
MATTPALAMAKRIELWPVEKLVPYERNARTHSPEQVRQLAASIAEFGFLNPILVDSKAGIIAGHGRLMAAKDMGLAEVPVVVLDHLNEAQRRAYVIADNKLALNASWDVDLLALEVDALRVEDFDIELLGFREEELKGLTENGWATDIEAVEKHEENLDGIQAKIVVKLDGTYKDEVIEAIRMYCDGHAISVEIG